jgi:hypothetical protein
MNLALYCILIDCYHHSSKSLLTVYQSTWLHMPEDSDLHTHLGGNLRFLKVIMLTMSLKMFLMALIDTPKVSKL